MKNSLLHTPEGVRDIYNGECARKMALLERLEHTLRSYGYQTIQTPTFEFFDVFNREKGTLKSREMYKFFDREGNTLVLRPDITPSIARAVAKYYGDESISLRFSYTGNVFLNNSSYQGLLKESTQLGAELINDNSADGDAEMTALSIAMLRESGLTEFQLDLGHADFFRALIEESGMDEEMEEQLKDLIENKNYFGIEDLINQRQIRSELKNILMKLPQFMGSVEILKEARQLTSNERALTALTRLEKIYELLGEYGCQKYVSFDLGMISQYNYYSGVIFKGYTYGTGDAVVKGGRYDRLIGQFGKDAPSIGFATEIDRIMAALSRQKIDYSVNEHYMMMLYSPKHKMIAIALANKLRAQGENMAMIRRDDQKTLEHYLNYGKRQQFASLYHLLDNQHMKLIDLSSGLQEDITVEALLGQEVCADE